MKKFFSVVLFVLLVIVSPHCFAENQITSLSSRVQWENGVRYFRTSIEIQSDDLEPIEYKILKGKRKKLAKNEFALEFSDAHFGNVQADYFHLHKKFLQNLARKETRKTTQLIFSLATKEDMGELDHEPDLKYCVYEKKFVSEKEANSDDAAKKENRSQREKNAAHEKFSRVLIVDIYDKNDTSAQNEFSSVVGKTIVLDPGHGGSDSGACGSVYGLREKEITLDVAKMVRDTLVSAGADVVMTRETDVDVHSAYASARKELQARVDVASKARQSEIFISIHCDAFSYQEANGTTTYYFEKTGQDKILARYLQNALVEQGQRRDRGIIFKNFYVLKYTKIPAALVELAFISNPEEEQLLTQKTFRETLAYGICQGIANYCAME